MPTQKEYKISIDPRILELLGPSLYTNVYFILAELIANAYDANAKNVYIIQEKGSLIVEDDGHGMSYEDGDIEKYLNVAQETRLTAEQEYVRGSDNKRKKMGRKGVGKLAALSVSPNVEIKTVKNGERSGFVLSRNVGEDRLLKPIQESEIGFHKIKNNGTAVVMRSPQYVLNKTIKAIRNNILKIFPLVDKTFRIHVEVGAQSTVIDSFEEDLVRGLGGLITLGREYEFLANYFDSQLKNRKEHEVDLLKKWPSYKKNLFLKCKDGEEDSFELEVRGWIGVYRSTRGRKLDSSDFPDNFISLLSNKKLGEYNILPLVGKNAMSEVYVVGQLHVDLFEETSLPDMALSNRQGYKTDDERYQEVLRYVRNELLPKAIGLRVKYASFVKQEKDEEKNRMKKQREELFKEQIERFKSEASGSAADMISDQFKSGAVDADKVKGYISKAINNSFPNMGVKKSIDNSKKKLLISHAGADKSTCDFIFDLLVFNGVPAGEIIYTSSDNPESVIPDKTPIFGYLRDFFVESYSTQGIYVIYVTSESMAKSWGAVSEVGAGWITKSEHEIFNVNSHKPEKPLDVDVAWANISNDSSGKVSLSVHEANRVVSKIKEITTALKYESKPESAILAEVKRLANLT